MIFLLSVCSLEMAVPRCHFRAQALPLSTKSLLEVRGTDTPHPRACPGACRSWYDEPNHVESESFLPTPGWVHGPFPCHHPGVGSAIIAWDPGPNGFRAPTNDVTRLLGSLRQWPKPGLSLSSLYQNSVSDLDKT